MPPQTKTLVDIIIHVTHAITSVVNQSCN